MLKLFTFGCIAGICLYLVLLYFFPQTESANFNFNEEPVFGVAVMHNNYSGTNNIAIGTKSLRFRMCNQLLPTKIPHIWRYCGKKLSSNSNLCEEHFNNEPNIP